LTYINNLIKFFQGDGSAACFDDYETKKHGYINVHAELALKEEELMKTRQFLKEVTNEKEELLLKVNTIIILTTNINNKNS